MKPDLERLPSGTVLILGAGLAGLYCALGLERPSVILTTDTPGRGGSSIWAQGGIAAALGPGDSPERHADDTIAAGAGLAVSEAVRVVTQEGPAHVRVLADLGVPFDRNDAGEFALSLEAAHRVPRVARVKGDLAGREIMKAVGNAVLARPQVTVRDGLDGRSLLVDDGGRVVGVIARDGTGRWLAIGADDVVLATGGIGHLYAVTTNPATACGDALAMAARSGALIENAEFVQFHPTAIDVGHDPAPLATEALRGEGAHLVDDRGEPLTGDPAIDLAARDVVARAVHRAKTEGRGAFLDATQAVGDTFPQRFPTVFSACQASGLDPRRERIPVAPAAHYHMGGVKTDLEGRSTVPGLWVLGEAASTGVHGANRLASNSLLEAVVFSARGARALDSGRTKGRAVPVTSEAPPELPPEAFQSLRRALAADAGVERDAAGLMRLIRAIEALEDTYGAANPLVAARLVAAAALGRRESRGAHYRRDAPDAEKPPRPTRMTLSEARGAKG